MKLEFADYMRAANVTRWHIVNTSRKQTLAEHQWLVMVIALELYQQRVGIEATDASCNEALGLLGCAMFHDIPEVTMGDPPGIAKDLFRKHGGPSLFTAIEGELVPHPPYGIGHGSDGVKRIVKMADTIEAAWWIHEHQIGTHAKMVAQRNWSALCRLVFQYEDEDGDVWHKPVNSILMALGMPYISVVRP